MATTAYPPSDPNIEYIYLTFWNKVAIASGAVGFLLFVCLCMVCIICPSCLCHDLCFGDNDEKGTQDKRKRKIGSQRSTSSKGSYGSTDSDYYYGVPEGTDSGPLRWKPLNIIRETDTDYSSDVPPAQEVIKLEPQKHANNGSDNGHVNGNGSHGDVTTKLEDGDITFTLEYSPTEEKLIIKILEVSNIKLPQTNALVSPYVKIRLYRAPKQFFTFRGASTKEQIINNLEKELKTKLQRPNEPLVYKESFTVPMSSEDLKSCTIRLLLCDMDKLSCHMILGETSTSFRKLDLSSEVSFKEKLLPPIEEDLGTITLGLSYLPTSEKLYLTIESITGLKVMDKNTGATDACVKAYLMYEGKQLKRIKTTVRGMDLNPVFNESFSFDVPKDTIENIYFSLMVCHYNIERKGTRIIGRVYMGTTFEQMARDHWKSMIQNPRKKIVSVYKIMP